MMKTMRTSGSESLAGASNIFLGQTEAALVIKPYLPKLTQSEIMALMTTGMSTIATGVMAVYAGMEGLSAGHILTASVLGAPAGLLVAKVMFPEMESSETGERCHFETKQRSGEQHRCALHRRQRRGDAFHQCDGNADGIRRGPCAF